MSMNTAGILDGAALAHYKGRAEKAEARGKVLEEALDSLHNAVAGLGAWDAAFQKVMGYANWEVLMHHKEKAGAALSQKEEE